jgi:hypothetical protein
MANSQHTFDAKDLEKKHKKVDGKTDGGACLSRHDAGRAPGPDGELKKHSCNHRWQAVEKAKAEKDRYEWTPERRKAMGAGRKIAMPARCKSGWLTRDVPTGAEWDVTTDPNFLTSCNRPYWHEAHHIVPNGEFKSAIASAGEGTAMRPYYVKLIRNGLLGESYNLNHKGNMVILPMWGRIAGALGLPRHRVTREKFNHSTYSSHVRTRLDEIFQPVQKDVKAHRSSDYKACKRDLERLSKRLYKKIVAAGKTMGGGALDEMTKKQLIGAEKKKGAIG